MAGQVEVIMDILKKTFLLALVALSCNSDMHGMWRRATQAAIKSAAYVRTQGPKLHQTLVSKAPILNAPGIKYGAAVVGAGLITASFLYTATHAKGVQPHTLAKNQLEECIHNCHHQVQIERTAHGLILPCPKIEADQSTVQKMQDILDKIKSDTLTQDDATLKLLKPGNFSGLGECRCELDARSLGGRAKFENRLVEICQKDLDKPFTYINYGSGLLFQDLVIATKLIQAGCRNITLICIDPIYSKFFETYKGVQLLHQLEGNLGDILVNNALCVGATYFSLLKNIYPDLSVTLKVYPFAEQAMQDNKSKSAQLIFASDFGGDFGGILGGDFGGVQGFIDNSLLLQGPEMMSPHYQDQQTGKYVLRDFFALSDALLAQRAIKARKGTIVTAQGLIHGIDICYHHLFNNTNVSLNKATLSNGQVSFLAVNNRYMFLMGPNNVVLIDSIDGSRNCSLEKQKCPFLDDLLNGKVALDESHARVLEKLVVEQISKK